MKAYAQPETVTIPAGKFKATCLKLMDEAVIKQQRFCITKRGKVVGHFVPAAPEEKPFRSIFGRTPNIRVPTEAEWREFKTEMADDWERSMEDTARQLNKPNGKTKRKTK